MLNETCFQIIILSAVKTGLQSYCGTGYLRCGVNQMWILKNSKDLPEDIWLLYPLHNYSSLHVDGQIKGVGPTVINKKEWPT